MSDGKWKVQNRIVQEHDDEGGFDYLLLLTPDGLQFDPRDGHKLEPMLKADLRHVMSHCGQEVTKGCGSDVMEEYSESASEGNDFGGVMIYNPAQGDVKVVPVEEAQQMEQADELESERVLSSHGCVVR